ncbi:MAG: hypothetical protein U0R68_01760 [Candidatus Nanopelagicales bacterium]
MSDGEKPSAESMREVKREYKERRKAEEQRAKDAKAYWDQQTGKKPKRSGGRAVAVVALVAATVGVAGVGAAVAKVGPFAASTASSNAAGATPSSAAASPTTASPSTAAATTSPTPSASALDADLTDKPFAGTPAAAWKVGATGLVAPKAARIGIYRTGQVKAAYAMVVAYLTKAQMDPRVTFQGKMDPVLATLGPGFPSHAKSKHALWVKTKGKKGFAWVDLANRFHPGDWKAAAQTRAKGRISKAVIKNGYLRIPYVFTTAYWVKPTKGGVARAIAIRRSGYLQFEGYGPRGVWMNEWLSNYTSSASVCGSDWKQPDYLEAWINVDAVPHQGGSPLPSYDLTDPDAPDPDGCFTDTSGFR